MKNGVLVTGFSQAALAEDVRIKNGLMKKKDNHIPLYYFNTLLQSGTKRIVFLKHDKDNISKYSLPKYITKRFRFMKEDDLYTYYHELIHLFMNYRKRKNQEIPWKGLTVPILNLSYLFLGAKKNYSILAYPNMLFDCRHNKDFRNNFDEKLVVPLEIMSNRMSVSDKPSISVTPHRLERFDIVEDIMESSKYEKYCLEHDKLTYSKIGLKIVLAKIRALSDELASRTHDISVKSVVINTLDWTNSNLLEKIEPISSSASNKIISAIKRNTEGKKRLVYYYHSDIINSDYIKSLAEEWINNYFENSK